MRRPRIWALIMICLGLAAVTYMAVNFARPRIIKLEAEFRSADGVRYGNVAEWRVSARGDREEVWQIAAAPDVANANEAFWARETTEFFGRHSMLQPSSTKVRKTPCRWSSHRTCLEFRGMRRF